MLSRAGRGKRFWFTAAVLAGVLGIAVFFFYRRNAEFAAAEHVEAWMRKNVPQGDWYSYTCDYPAVYPISGFTTLSRLEIFRTLEPEIKEHAFEVEGQKFRLVWDGRANRIAIHGDSGSEVARFDLVPFLEKLARNEKRSVNLPQKLLTLDSETARIFFDDISAVKTEQGWEVFHFKSDIVWKLR